MANPEKQQPQKKDDGQDLVVRNEPTAVARPERHPVSWREPFELMRDLMSVDPFGSLLMRGPFREMRDMMRSFWEAWPERRERAWYPAFEVRETEDAYLIAGDLPGLSADDLDVAVTGDRLEISGKREEKQETAEGEYRTYERAYGSFTRTFAMPDDVDTDRVSSRLESGVLELVLPKKPGAKPAKRKIEVKTGGERH